MSKENGYEIKVEEFSTYFKMLSSNEYAALNKEFQKINIEAEKIEERDGLSVTEAKDVKNLTKNRYSEILPFDQNRVKIVGKKFPEDYINASYIPFIDKESEYQYIATQGPLKSTVFDFWQMILDQNITLIMMLTKISEGEKEKCFQYYPESIGSTSTYGEYNNISVLFFEEKENKSYIERIFLVKTNISKIEKRITQLHMYSWNDHCVPSMEYMDNILMRYHQLENMGKNYPHLIHCSAGVGRTGTLISIYRIISGLITGMEKIDIYHTVLKLRQYRALLVEQESLYIFIYEYIDHFLKKYSKKDNEGNESIYFEE